MMPGDSLSVDVPKSRCTIVVGVVEKRFELLVDRLSTDCLYQLDYSTSLSRFGGFFIAPVPGSDHNQVK